MALVLGHHRIDRSILTAGIGVGEPVWVPVVAAALWDGRHRVLVDTGHHDTQWVSRNMAQATCAPDEELVQALKIGPGWTPDEVEVVINTHLHFDHCGHNALFQRAKFFVDQREWEGAYAPPAGQEKLYYPPLFDSRAVNFFNWEFVKEDSTLFEGLSLIETPGHSVGHMSVLANTDQGVLCVAGDACGIAENVNGNLMGGVCISAAQMEASFQKVRRCAERIIPGHDALIRPFQREGFPQVVKPGECAG